MIPKFIGRDCELSASGFDHQGRPLSQTSVTQHLLDSLRQALAKIDLRVWSAQPRESVSRYAADCSRQWLENGMCFYSDQSHPECCSGELLSPRQFAASSFAMLHVAELARSCAEAEAEPGTRYHITAANADTADPAISWGSHLNVSVSKPLWEGLFVDVQRPALLNYVASVMAAAIAFFGSGLLLTWPNGDVVYSTSARAHQIRRLSTHSTMQAYGRGLLNTRREAHAQSLDRLHLIPFDYTLLGAAPLASLLQCALAAAEEGHCPVSLLEPVSALHAWSFGLNAQTHRIDSTARLVDGRCVKLAGYMRQLAQDLLVMVEKRQIPAEIAPEADYFLPQIIELCDALEIGDLPFCARRLDWAAKLMVLLDLSNEPGVRWGDAKMRLADHDFTHTDPQRGAIWRLWDEDLVDPQVTGELVEQFVRQAPSDGRGWARGQLIQRFCDQISDVNWDHVELRCGLDRWSPRVRVEMPDPESLSRAEFAAVLDRSHDVHELIRRLSRPRGSGTDVTDVDPLVSMPHYLATEHAVDDRLGYSRRDS